MLSLHIPLTHKGAVKGQLHSFLTLAIDTDEWYIQQKANNLSERTSNCNALKLIMFQ
jgi:hypothetical protein